MTPYAQSRKGIIVRPSAPTLLAATKAHPLGADASAIGRAVEDPNHFVEMRTSFGIVDWLSGEQLPPICYRTPAATRAGGLRVTRVGGVEVRRGGVRLGMSVSDARLHLKMAGTAALPLFDRLSRNRRARFLVDQQRQFHERGCRELGQPLDTLGTTALILKNVVNFFNVIDRIRQTVAKHAGKKMYWAGMAKALSGLASLVWAGLAVYVVCVWLLQNSLVGAVNRLTGVEACGVKFPLAGGEEATADAFEVAEKNPNCMSMRRNRIARER